MARPQRNNVDYFPFLCDEGKKMFYIEETYGNDGFATFIKILKELAKTDYHYLDLSKNTTLMFLSAKCKISKQTLELIINDLVDLGKFDSVLWNENRVIWCQDFVDSIQDAYSKRKNKCITYDGLIHLLVSLGVRKPSKHTLKGRGNTQSKVEYSKEDKTIEEFNSEKQVSQLSKTNDFLVLNAEEEKEKKIAPKKRKRFEIPSRDEILNHMMIQLPNEVYCGAETAKFFNYYESVGWYVGKKKMVNWKAAATNWLKRSSDFNKPQKQSTLKTNLNNANNTMQDAKSTIERLNNEINQGI